MSSQRLKKSKPQKFKMHNSDDFRGVRGIILIALVLLFFFLAYHTLQSFERSYTPPPEKLNLDPGILGK